MVEAVAGRKWSDAQAQALAEAVDETLADRTLDPAFKAKALGLPTEAIVARAIGTDIDPDHIHEVRRALTADLVGRIAESLAQVYLTNDSRLDYSPDAAQAGRREMKNMALTLLVGGGASDGARLAREQYEGARNMTNRLAALAAVVGPWTEDAPALLADFRARYGADPLVLDKWLTLNATSPDPGALDRVKAILAEPDFPANNPNRLRALVGAFASANATQFPRADGEGFRFVASFVADVDKRNPQVAARVLTAFRVWKSFETGRRGQAEAALTALRDGPELSRNTGDILQRILEG
jgi:aminopeptidase N